MNATIENKASEIIDIYATPSFNPNNYVGRRAYYERYDGTIDVGILTVTSTGRMEIRTHVGWAGVGSYLYLADKIA